MGRKIFVSYKYTDDSVQDLPLAGYSTVRDYVTEFENLLKDTDHVYKGEGDDEDLSDLDDETIWGKLRDRIYDSTLTVVFISPNMRETGVKERDQWIPWEVSYSLRETSRRNTNGDPVTSKTNAMIGVVLPDAEGSYSYYLENRTCCADSCTIHHTSELFQIVRDNKFNLKDASKRVCDSNLTVWSGECSYIRAVRWNDFVKDPEKHIIAAYKRQDNLAEYEIVKVIT